MSNRTQSEMRDECQLVVNVFAKNGRDLSATVRELSTNHNLELSQATVLTRLKAAAERYNLSPTKMTKGMAKVKAAAKGKKETPIAPPTPKEMLEAKRAQRAETDKAKSLNTHFIAQEEELQDMRARLEVFEALKTPTKSAVIPVPKAHGGHGILVVLASDWHVEENVDPASVLPHINEYNPDIAVRRSTKFFQSVLTIFESQQHLGKCETIVLALLGDFVSGHIHDELVESNHMSPLQAIRKSREIISNGIRFLLANTKANLLIPCSYGNHGRTTQKPRFSTGAANSFEHMMYGILADEFRNEKRVRFQIADGYHNVVTLFNTRIRFHHGDAIKSGGGVGGLTIPTKKMISRWNKDRAVSVDVDAFGHHHQAFDGGNFVSNGSLIGYNAYALQFACEYERPKQMFFWVDSKRGKTLSGELYVE